MSATREYRLLCRVSETDYAETFRAVTTMGGEAAQPALVHLLMPRATEVDVLRRIKQHVTALLAIRSPNLLMPWGFGRARDRWALAFPCPSGHSLDVLLNRVRAREFSVPLPRAIQLIAEAANGMAALHQRGLCHGGIGPDDVLLSFDGGVSLQADGLRFVLESLRSTRHLAQRGRKRYRAPELARGAAVGPACDVFALGAVAFELITGQPFDGAVRAGSSIRSDSVQLPSRLDRRIPAKFDQVLIRAVESAPTRRYATGALFRDALWEYLDGMGQVVTPAELAELAATVMPNEVVTRAFDPEEQPSGAVPVGGSFSIEASAIPEAALVAPRPFDQEFSSHPEEVSSGAGGDIFARDSTIKLTIPDLGEEDHTDAGDPSDDIDEERHASHHSPQGTPEAWASMPEAGVQQRPESSESSVEVEAALEDSSIEEPHRSEPAEPPSFQASSEYCQETWASSDPAPLDGDTDAERAIPTEPPAAPDRGAPHPWEGGGGARTARIESESFLPGFLAMPVPLLIVAAVAIVFGAVGFTVGRLSAPSATVTTPDFLTSPPATQTATPAELRGQTKGFDVFSLLSDAAAAAAEPPPPPAVAQSEEPAPPAAAADAPPERSKRVATGPRGRLTIQANQRAKVYIDGRDTGRYTPLRGYAVRAGRREVKLVTDDGKTQTRTVMVRANQVNQVRMRVQ